LFGVSINSFAGTFTSNFSGKKLPPLSPATLAFASAGEEKNTKIPMFTRGIHAKILQDVRILNKNLPGNPWVKNGTLDATVDLCENPCESILSFRNEKMSFFT